MVWVGYGNVHTHRFRGVCSVRLLTHVYVDICLHVYVDMCLWIYVYQSGL